MNGIKNKFPDSFKNKIVLCQDKKDCDLFECCEFHIKTENLVFGNNYFHTIILKSFYEQIYDLLKPGGLIICFPSKKLEKLFSNWEIIDGYFVGIKK